MGILREFGKYAAAASIGTGLAVGTFNDDVSFSDGALLGGAGALFPTLLYFIGYIRDEGEGGMGKDLRGVGQATTGIVAVLGGAEHNYGTTGEFAEAIGTGMDRLNDMSDNAIYEARQTLSDMIQPGTEYGGSQGGESIPKN